MFDLTESDIKEYAKKCKKSLKNEDKVVTIGTYTLEYVIECGLKYIYGEEHMFDGHIVDCQTSFKEGLKLQKSHDCKKDFLSTEISMLGLGGKVEHFQWTGLNLAFITSENLLYAYFKKQQLFKCNAQNVTALTVTNKKIYMGKNSGEIVYKEPVGKTEEVFKRHTAPVTKIKLINDTCISSSEDGSLYCNSTIKFTEAKIVDFAAIKNALYLACSDFTVIKAIYEENCLSSIKNIQQFKISNLIGHTDEITKISSENFVCTSSKDGKIGIINETLNLYPVDGIKHIQRKEEDLLTYGLENIKRFDLNREEAFEVFKSKSNVFCASTNENIVAFSREDQKNILCFKDLRSNSLISKEIDKNIKDVSFSPTFEHLFITTDNDPIICDLRKTL